ncbi:hypothetical protein As57867_015528, partial [Aphanomyces stellatus]
LAALHDVGHGVAEHAALAHGTRFFLPPRRASVCRTEGQDAVGLGGRHDRRRLCDQCPWHGAPPQLGDVRRTTAKARKLEQGAQSSLKCSRTFCASRTSASTASLCEGAARHPRSPLPLVALLGPAWARFPRFPRGPTLVRRRLELHSIDKHVLRAFHDEEQHEFNAAAKPQHTTLDTVVNTNQGLRGTMTPAPLFDGQLLRGHGRGTDVLPASTVDPAAVSALGTSDPSHQHPCHGRRQPHPDVADATLACQHRRPDARYDAFQWEIGTLTLVSKPQQRLTQNIRQIVTNIAQYCRGGVLYVSLLMVVITALHMLLSYMPWRRTGTDKNFRSTPTEYAKRVTASSQLMQFDVAMDL